VPYDTTDIKVLVDGVEVAGWDYIAGSNSIKFQQDAIPANNAEIEVIYSLEDN
jgi:hypothetical protein